MNTLVDSDGDGLIDLAENVPPGIDTDSEKGGIADAVEIGRYWNDSIDSNDGFSNYCPNRLPCDLVLSCRR